MSWRGENLKKILFLFGVAFLLLLGIIGAQDDTSKVSSEVLDQLDNNNKVNVIVVLKEEQEFGALNLDYYPQEVVEQLDSFEVEHEFDSFNGFSGEISEDDLETLLDDDRVERIEYNYPVKAFLQDSTSLVNASFIWNFDYGLGSVTGIDQSVCVLDTGIDYTHADLGGCNVTGNISDGSCNKIVAGYDFVNDNDNPMDDHGHGTHVAGIVAASGNITGVAPNSTLIAIKVLDASGEGNSADIISGIEWCTSKAQQFNISVITMSLGGSLSSTACDSDVIAPSVNNAVAAGISVIAASGNSGSSTQVASPACITNVTAVGSTDKSDAIWSLTNRNSLLDLLAPGENINSTNITDIYGDKSGTSM